MRIPVPAALVCGLFALACPAAAPAAPEATAVPGVSVAGEAITRAADGTMWVAEPNSPGAVARIATSGAVTEYTGGVTSNFPASRNPSNMAAMPDGSVWFLLSGGSEEFGRVTAAGTVGRRTLVVGRPTSLVAGPDGYLWATAEGDTSGEPDRIVRIDTSTNSATHFTTGFDENSNPRSITLGADGALWFVEGGGAGRVGRITTAGELSWQAVGGAPAVLAAGPLSSLWFARGADLGQLAGGGVSLFDAGRTTSALALGPDGALYAAATGGVIRTDAEGATTFLTLGLDGSAKGNGIAAGPDGRMWMTLDRTPFLVRITVPPLVKPTAAKADSATTASISADVSPNGLATDARVEVRSAGGAWRPAGSTALAAGTAPVPVSFSVTGLAPSTAQELRIVATSTAGAVTGATAAVSTPAVPVLPTPTTTTPTPTVAKPAPVVTKDPTTETVAATPTVAVTTPAALTPDAPAPAPATTDTTPTTSAAETAVSPTVDVAPEATAVPSQGRAVVLAPVTGSVRYRVPGKTDYLPVDGNATVPVGAVVDATNGTVVLASQVGGSTQEGRFHGGVFKVRQPANGTGVTQLVLAGELACSASTAKTTIKAKAGSSVRALRAKKKPPVRRLWGEDRGGRFQTHGHDAVATVRGTSWLTQDTCKGTLVRVYQGAVDVKATGTPKAKAVLVGAGQSRFTKRRP